MDNYNFDKDAYDLLCRCSEQKDFSRWDLWRKEQKKEIFLEGAILKGKYLKHVNLSHVHLSHASMEGADLQEANLKRAWLNDTRLNNAHLYRADFKDANIKGARLQGANMIEADLKGANARYTFLEKTNLHHTFLQGADFSYAIVNGETLLDTDKIDQHTLFTSVGLSSARLKPGLADSLNYNIRRMRWEQWYDKGNFFASLIKKTFVRPFWMISNYGRSTARIILIFMSLAITFALIYWNYPEIIQNLEKGEHLCKLYKTLYFSIVTMITLGFGNMNASPHSFLGNTAVTFQIISGYVILAALVTRISVLFSSGGPAIPLKKTRKKFSDIEN